MVAVLTVLQGLAGQSTKAVKRPHPVKTQFGDVAKTSFILLMDQIKKVVVYLQPLVVVRITSMKLKDQTLMDVPAKVLNLVAVQMTFQKLADLTMKVFCTQKLKTFPQ